ncbi:hypothetical protein [Pseudonocardia sp.]|uniref:hypothetical protein n=1 Tax=Pseudonocardia sp. TaxID=60912 RepID=UPI003D0A29C9
MSIETTAYSATALATTDTAKLHRLTIVMIRVLLGVDTPKPSTMRALIARGLYVVADQQGGAVISPEGVKVARHMVTEYDLATGQEEETPEVTQETGPRSEVTHHEPLREGNGSTRTWSRVLRGVPHGFTAVLMPDGERRYAVRKYNGYGDDGTPEGRANGMRFDCAWTQVAFWTVKPSPAMTQILDEPLRQTERTLSRPSLGTVGASESGSRDSAEGPGRTSGPGAEHLARAVDLGPDLPPHPTDDPSVSGIWAILHGRRTVEGREIIRGMILNTPVIGDVTVGKVQLWSETVHVDGRDSQGRPVELSMPSNHRVTLVDAPEQLALI